MKPLISVIIPCFNVSRYLPQCMESLERQTIGIGNLELIFVDDASTDGGETWRCITEFERRYPDSVIAVHLEKNGRQGGARNAGLCYANADYIGFVDSDDWIEPQMYERLYRCVRENECDIAGCRMFLNFSDGTEVPYEKEDAPEEFVRYEKSIIEGGMHWVSDLIKSEYSAGIYAAIYRKVLLMKPYVSFPEHMKYEDNYWQPVLLLYARSFYHLPDNLYHYRQHDASTVHERNDVRQFDRLDIELMKLDTYRKLGIFERFAKEVEWDFLGYYYANTLWKLWLLFDEPPYEVFVKMTDTVKALFPDYRENPYLSREQESLKHIMIGLIDRNLNRQQFLETGNIVLEWSRGDMEEKR